MLRALRRRNFALLWFGQMISLLGDWVLLVALPFYVYDVTHSALATGAMFIASTLPMLCGSFAGVFVDRWDRRRTMIVCDFARAALLLTLFLARSAGLIWLVYVVAFIEASISLFFLPAKSAIIPALVSDQDLVAANSLNSLSDAMTRLLGPSIGGALLALLGITSVITIDSLSYLVSGIMILLIVMPRTPATADERAPEPRAIAPWSKIWREWIEGLRVVVRERLLAFLFAGVAVMMVSEGIFQVLIVVFVNVILHGGATMFGLLMTVQGVGALIGTFIVGWLSKLISPKYLLILALVVAGADILFCINIQNIVLIMIVYPLVGVSVVAFMVSIQTLIQRGTADEYRGRVFGAYYTLMTLTMLLGMALASALSSVWGIMALLNIGGACFLAGALVLLGMPKVPAVPVAEAAQSKTRASGQLPQAVPTER